MSVSLISSKISMFHNLNIENYILFHRLTEELNPGYSLSDSSEGLSQKGNEKPGYIGGSAKQKQVKKKKIKR